ncbi:hypothetical protein L208DRAFT_1476600 [Tricholoma matsutake]|nr:hypothetical protein L208DRAFT_1476600 [Tricholoma matsutake 945]
MSTEQAKTAPVNQDPSYPLPPVSYPHNFNGTTFPPPGPPGAYPQPFYPPYPPPPEGGAHPENGQNSATSAPYMMFHAPPPGVFLAYPPPSQNQGYTVPQSPQNSALRPKRKQVKMACTNCAAACKRCDEHRPCERCLKYGIAESCVDGQRKERKKGIKRGPYKRKNKNENPTEGGWATASLPSAQNPSAPATVSQPVPPFPPNPGEGFYPYFYPHPGGFIPHPHEGQTGQEGSPPHNNGQPPIMPYYIHPGGYAAFPPPYPLYSPQGPPMSQSQSQPAQTSDSADAAKKAVTTVNGGEANGASGPVEAAKRPRTSKSGEPKAKKPKTVNPRDVNGTKGDQGITGNEGTNTI